MKFNFDEYQYLNVEITEAKNRTNLDKTMPKK